MSINNLQIDNIFIFDHVQEIFNTTSDPHSIKTVEMHWYDNQGLYCFLRVFFQLN